MADLTETYIRTVELLRNDKGAGARWETCLRIAREIGADAMNVAFFKEEGFAPIWIRISTHEQGGVDEYVQSGFLEVDPVLVMRSNNTLKEIDHVSLSDNIASGRLSSKELACHQHLVSFGQSDYLTFRIRRNGEDGELLVVFACGPEWASRMQKQIAELTIIANIFALYIGPPTPDDSVGKIPLLYEFVSDREREILRLVAKGLQNAEISHQLGIAEVTVRAHTISARKKMNASTRAQAVALAFARGLITL